jgi:hypothetical protein
LCVYALGTKEEQAALEGSTEKASTETAQVSGEEASSNE